jgi:hypothetical protein
MGLDNLLSARVRTLPTAKYVFAAIVALLFVIAAGQWYVLGGLTALYLGVPLWLWLQLALLVAMLFLAWVAMSVWTAANDGDSPAGTGGDGRTEW